MAVEQDTEFRTLNRAVTRRSVLLVVALIVLLIVGLLAVAYVVAGLMPANF